MKILLWIAFILTCLIGCQGTPRYGGGLHTDEGSYRTAESGQTAEADLPASTYAVDPLVLGAIIDRYIGLPYSNQNNLDSGYDCSEFVGAVYQEYASIHLPRTTDKLFKAGRQVEGGDLYFGDLVFFDTGGQGVSHVGIYIGFDEFAHASKSNGIIISSLNDKYYSQRFVGARRVME